MSTLPTSEDNDGEADPDELGCLFGCIGVLVCLVAAVIWSACVAWFHGGLNGHL